MNKDFDNANINVMTEASEAVNTSAKQQGRGTGQLCVVLVRPYGSVLFPLPSQEIITECFIVSFLRHSCNALVLKLLLSCKTIPAIKLFMNKYYLGLTFNFFVERCIFF